MTKEQKQPEQKPPELPEANPKKEEAKQPRVFVYDGREFSDPGDKMSTDEVRQYYMQFFPELANAEVLAAVVRPSKTAGYQEQIIEFKRRVGTKGNGTMPDGMELVANPYSIYGECPSEIRRKAQEIWQDMSENEKTGVRFGMFPFARMTVAEKLGFEGRSLAVALMECAKNDGGMRA